jgi:hypothetical protein
MIDPPHGSRRARYPTYRENSHAHHTWDPPWHQTACFKGSGAPHQALCAVLIFDGFIPLADGKTDALILEIANYDDAAASVTMAVPYVPKSTKAEFKVYRQRLPNFLRARMRRASLNLSGKESTNTSKVPKCGRLTLINPSESIAAKPTLTIDGFGTVTSHSIDLGRAPQLRSLNGPKCRSKAVVPQNDVYRWSTVIRLAS